MTEHDNGDNTTSSHRRRCLSAPFPVRCRSALFPVGSSVEVNTNEEGFTNVYFSATVIPASRKRSKKMYVQYTDLLTHESGSDPLREHVNVECVRPVPPSEQIVWGFEPDDVVDAFYQDGWWVGVVTRVVEASNKYIVSFDSPADQLEFNLDDLRPHWDWIHGKWVRPQSKSRNQIEVGRRVEVSFEGEDYQDAWFPATIQECLENGEFLVEYGEAIMANADALHVRPCPPLVRGKKEFTLLSKVEAFFDFGWRSGIITKDLENSRYLVFFRQMKEDKEFDQSELRAHMEWNDGEWLLFSVDENSSPTASSANRGAHSSLTKRRLYHSDQGAALKRHHVGNAEGVKLLSSVSGMETSIGSEAIYSKMPKGFRVKCVARKFKRTLARVDQEEGPEEFVELVEESPSPGQDTSRNIAFEVEENFVVEKMMVVENVVGEVVDNQEEGPQEPACVEEVNPSSAQEEEQNISGKIAVKVEDPVASFGKEVVKEVCIVSDDEIDEESVSKYIEEMDSATAFDSSGLPQPKQCSSMHNNSTVSSEPHNLPFEKTTVLWQIIESIEVFQRFPQNPHFQPLAQQNIALREGLAIGHMVNFSNLVKQTSRLQVSDPKSSMDEIMGTLPFYETHGFDVSAIRECISKLLVVKDREEKLVYESNNLKKRILVLCHERNGIVEERREICEQMRKLQEKLLLVESAAVKVDEEIASLQAGVEETERKIKNGRDGLKVKL